MINEGTMVMMVTVSGVVQEVAGVMKEGWQDDADSSHSSGKLRKSSHSPWRQPPKPSG